MLTAMLVATMPAHAIDIPHEQFQLENGLNVILHEDHSLPQVVVNLWYGVGSKDEEIGRSGFAHLFEHLMFMGTVHLPGSGFDERMEAYGGWNNAWTSEDATDYYEAGPSNLLQTFLWMESDRMRDLAKAMTQEKLDLQRDVVRNERRQSVEDTPYGIIWEAMSPALYPADHPYGHTVIGTHEDLQAATLDDVIRFFDTWYVPNNASLVIAGDFDPETAKQWVSNYFGPLKAGVLPERASPAPLAMPQQAVVETTDNVQIPLTVMAWHTPAVLQEGDATFDVLASILGDGRSSRLYEDLITNTSTALEAGAWQYSQKLGSIFALTGKPAEGTALGSVDVTFADSGATAGSPASYTNVTSTATAPAAFAFDATTGTATLTINNGTTPQQVTIELGAPGTNTGMTQFAGDYTPVESTLDGFESGQLVRFEIDESGDLYGVFDNSARRLLYNIPLAEVTNPDGLRQVDGNAYIPTQSSGDFQLNTAGTGTAGSITAGALEASNVELAEELTMLIQTQRAYSSNAKIITTVDQMMEETTALKR